MAPSRKLCSPTEQHHAELCCRIQQISKDQLWQCLCLSMICSPQGMSANNIATVGCVAHFHSLSLSCTVVESCILCQRKAQSGTPASRSAAGHNSVDRTRCNFCDLVQLECSLRMRVCIEALHMRSVVMSTTTHTSFMLREVCARFSDCELAKMRLPCIKSELCHDQQHSLLLRFTGSGPASEPS